jgi:hypothetical protein
MLTATQPNTTPTRRSALGFSAAAIVAGLTVPALAGAANPDAELLTAFTEFELVGKRLRWINNAIPGAELSEAECRASLDRFYDLLARIAEMTPHTPEGWRAKTVVAYRALASTAPLAGEPLEREEQFALDTLLGLLGGAA